MESLSLSQLGKTWSTRRKAEDGRAGPAVLCVEQHKQPLCAQTLPGNGRRGEEKLEKLEGVCLPLQEQLHHLGTAVHCWEKMGKTKKNRDFLMDLWCCVPTARQGQVADVLDTKGFNFPPIYIFFGGIKKKRFPSL